MKKEIAFICRGNSSRSQMAEAFAKKYAKGCMNIYSAGIVPGHSINENVIIVMEEKGIKMDSFYPKKVTEIPHEVDMVVLVGDDIDCPDIHAGEIRVWKIKDPVGKELDFFRKARDIIEKNIIGLIKETESKGDK